MSVAPVRQVEVRPAEARQFVERPFVGRTAWWGSVVALVVLVHVAVSLSGRSSSFALTTFGDVAECTVLLFALCAMFSNVRSNRGPARLFWLLLGSGFGLWLAAQLAWTYLEVLRRVAVPNPFSGDIVLFIHIVPLVAALAMQPDAGAGSRRFGVLDFMLLLVWWLYLYLVFVIPWQYVNVNLKAYGTNFDLLYLVEEILFVVGVGILWRRTSNAWRKVYANLFFAGALYTVGSYLASEAIDRGTYFSGSFYDLPIDASIAWFGVAGFAARSLLAQAEPSELPSGAMLFWPARVAMLSVLSTPLVACWIAFFSGTPPQVIKFRLLVSLLAIFLLAALVFLKQSLLDRQLVNLLQRANASVENLKRVQGQLVQTEKMAALGQLVAGAAHEINNPLAAIMGYAELLKGAELPEAPRSLASKIIEQARRTKSLVNDLLTFAQEHATARQPIHLDAVLNSAVKLREPDAVAKNAYIEVRHKADLPPVAADGNQMLQVFLHLIANGLDALEEAGGGILKVTTQVENGNVVVEFRDNGTGIKQPDRIFDPFFTTKPVGKGAGLGLSVCYGIVQAHKGEIACMNNPDSGATFRVSLPLL